MTVTRYPFLSIRYTISVLAILFLIGSLSAKDPEASPKPGADEPVASPKASAKEPWEIDGLSPRVLQLALQAAEVATKQGLVSGRVLGVIDFSLPSTTRRFWVLDREQKRVLFHEFVAHGKGSGENFATSFSNRLGSLQSSLGLYITESTYEGNHGYSLRLHGLEAGVNDQARPRAIVIHGAWYVSQTMISQHQRLGRSQGCPAVEESVVKPLIDTLKDGNLIFAYYPDNHWLSTSRFLNP